MNDFLQEIVSRQPDDLNAETCLVCNAKATFLCGGCQSVEYCGKACQRKHWKLTHRRHCAEVREDALRAFSTQEHVSRLCLRGVASTETFALLFAVRRHFHMCKGDACPWILCKHVALAKNIITLYGKTVFNCAMETEVTLDRALLNEGFSDFFELFLLHDHNIQDEVARIAKPDMTENERERLTFSLQQGKWVFFEHLLTQ